MKKTILFIVTTCAILFINTASADRQLSSDEIRKLYSNQTINSYHLIKDFDISVYFNPNGQFYGIKDDSIFQGKWEVTNNGTICMTREGGKTFCRQVHVDNGTYYKVKVKGNGKLKRILEYKSFSEGNTKNYKLVK